jgi:hypothetical protein
MSDGNDPMAPGHDILTNPDNLDTSLNSLMINEHRIDSNRFNATSPYNVTQNAQILKVDLANPTKLSPVAYVNQIEDRTHMETGNQVGIKWDPRCFTILWRGSVVSGCSRAYDR